MLLTVLNFIQKMNASYYNFLNKKGFYKMLSIITIISSFIFNSNATNTNLEINKNNKRVREEEPFSIENKQSEQTEQIPQKKEKISQNFDDLRDLEVSFSQIIKQKRDEKNIKKYPLASMYYHGKLLKKASSVRENLTKICELMCKKVDNIKCIIPELKEIESTIRKIDKEYHGDFKRMLDIVRATITAPDFATLRQAIIEFKKYFLIVSTKNRFREPLSSGYRDFNVVFYDKSVDFYGEMQFHLAPIFKLKSLDHDQYEIIRLIEGEARQEQRALTTEEKEKIDSINQQRKEKYDLAFQKILESEKH